MGDDRRTANQDYYKVAGRSGGPGGPLWKFKRELSTNRASERWKGGPPSGHKRGAAEEVERQLAEVHAEHDRHAKHQAAHPAAASASMKAAPIPRESVATARVLAAKRPADEGVAEHVAAPWADHDASGTDVPWDAFQLTPLQSWGVRLLSPVFRTLAGAARLVDRPIRRTLDVLQWLGHEAQAS